MIYKVDKTKVVHGTWENDWYECPNCGYDSLDIAFEYCPICGEGLDWSDAEGYMEIDGADKETLKRLEWSIPGNYIADECPICGNARYQGHKANCKLAERLKKYDLIDKIKKFTEALECTIESEDEEKC